MRYAYIVIILLIFLPITSAALTITPVAKKDIVTEAGKVAGATCDVQQAYSFLQARTIGNGWKVTPGLRGNSGLDPEFACRLERFFKATGCGQIFSGVRDRADQARISGNSDGSGRKGVNSYKNSCHTYGLAVDVNGCYQYRNIMGQFGLHFPYNTTHIQCVEHRAPQCSEQTLSCSGMPQTNTIQNVIGGYYSNSKSQLQKQLYNKLLQPQQPQQPSQASQTASRPIYNPYPQPTSATSSTSKSGSGVASLTCEPRTISNTEKSLISWSCGTGATRSRGGTTRRGSSFNTKSLLSGKGYARPSETISYKVQCLAGDKVIGESVCTIKVSTSGDNESILQNGTVLTRTTIHLSAEDKMVRWGSGTSLEWSSVNTGQCRLKSGGRVLAEGTSGTVETGRLFRTTVYALECSTSRGTRSVKTEVRIR